MSKLDDQRRAWETSPHEHCHCGSRLVEQPYDGKPPLCIDCGYPDAECKCEEWPCDFCGPTPEVMVG